MSTTPPAKSAKPAAFVPHRDDEAEVCGAMAEAAHSDGRVLTPEELRRWAETGEWPESSS